MQNHYQILGVNSSASPEEIRRAYRILARRYHPDVNPGKASEDRFKIIAQAYEVLSDVEKRRQFDFELGQSKGGEAWRRSSRTAKDPQRARRRYQEASQFQARGETRPPNTQTHQARSKAAPHDDPILNPRISAALGKILKFSSDGFRHIRDDLFGAENDERTVDRGTTPRQVSVVEVSLILQEAVFGCKKTIELPEQPTARKVSIRIPAGIRQGSVLRLRSKEGNGEELICIFRVAQHPTITLQPKGLIVDVPITIREALGGASVVVPTLDDSIALKIPPGTQNGTEFRVAGRGIREEGKPRGDIFYRVVVELPTCYQAVGIQDKAAALEQYYETPIRGGFPKRLFDEA